MVGFVVGTLMRPDADAARRMAAAAIGGYQGLDALRFRGK